MLLLLLRLLLQVLLRLKGTLSLSLLHWDKVNG
jgi:hypothetical protein